MTLSGANRAIAAAVIATLVLTACGGGGDDADDGEAGATDAGVATLGGDTGDLGEPEVLGDSELLGMRDDAVLSFSKCVREQGISNFPDLNSETIFDFASFVSTAVSAGIDLQEQATTDAMEACAHYFEEVSQLAPQPSQDEQAQQEETVLALVECVRNRGFPDLPDPDFSQGVDNSVAALAETVDPEDPALQAALALCFLEVEVELGDLG